MQPMILSLGMALRRLFVSGANLVRSFFPFTALLVLSVSLTSFAHAQTTATGTIEGRVLNVSNDTYLNNARVTAEGTGREAFTDAYGQYRLTDVPAGPVKLRVFYTGLTQQEYNVSVAAGQSVTQDVRLSIGGTSNGEPEAVRLEAFVVDSHKDTDQKAIAINEQRFAPNLKTVVAANAFGDVTEGNVGEFLKYMPGISLEYTSPDARQIIIRGVNPIYTSVLVDGMRMASAASSGSNRFFELEQASINNVTRVETVFSPTPDLPADALGGSVNMVSKKAFEHTHAEFDYRVYLSANGDEKSIDHKPGPASEPSRKIRPGFDFSFADPISKTLGFTLNVSESNIFYPQHRSQPTWTPIANGLGGTPTAPFLRTYQMQDGPKNTQRESVGASIDWKFTPHDTLSFQPQWNYYNAFFGNRNINWNVQGTSNVVPTAFDGPSFVQGAPGAGSASYGSSFRRKYGYTYHLGLDYLHSGPQWTFDVGAAYSHASNHYHDVQDGHFENVGLSMTKLTVGFAGINTYNGVRPATITTTDTNGTPIDSFSNLGAYTINSASYNEADSSDLFKTLKISAKHDLNWSWITTLKVGALVQQEFRDIRKPSGSYTFVGPDGKPGTADDLASNYNIIDKSYSSVSAPYGLPQVQWPSPYALYSLMQAHPEYFVWNQAGAITNAVKASQFFKETIPAAYIMGDSRFVDNRLRLVYGIRFEQTQDTGYGYLQNVNAIYQRDANGNFILNGTSKVPIIAPNGLPITDPSNAVFLAQTQYGRGDRALVGHARYGSGFPSVNATYNVTDNLIARASFSRTIGRPDIANLVPGTALPDPSGSTPYALTLNNPALQPEYSNGYEATLEYYFSKVGLVSVSAYRKDFSNFFGSITVPATADLLNQLAVPDASYYLQNNATITSKFNVGTARITGIQLDYKQSLDGIIPLNGFNVFSSGYATHLTGASNADFTNFISKAFNAGISYDRRKFGAKVNFNYRGTQRYGSTTYSYAADPTKPTVLSTVSGYEYYKPRPQFDIDLDYRISAHAGLFFVGRNITNVVQDDQRYTSEMPGYTHLFRREEFGVQFTFGVKGTF